MRRCSILLAGVLPFVSGHLSLHAQGHPTEQHVSVRMSVEGNSPIITLAFRKPDGSVRTAQFLFDSGGGAILLDQRLAADIGLKPQGPVITDDDGQQYQAVKVPAASIGGMPLDLGSSKAFVHIGAASFLNRDKVEGMLPGKALEPYQVVLNYPQQQFSVGIPGSLPHRGEMLPCPYIASSGHPRLDVRIDGASYGFLFDTGTQITLIREDLLHRWSRQHPDWTHSAGAVGPANEGTDRDVFLLRIPIFQLGPFRVNGVVAASRPNGTYSATSFETPAPIVGALGGNVLRQFRVEIDYPAQKCFFEHSDRQQTNEFDTVGLVLDTNTKGELVVRAVSSTASNVTRRNVLPGDIILQIGASRGAPYTLAKAAQALSGIVGQRKDLRILRDGKQMTVVVVVSRIL